MGVDKLKSKIKVWSDVKKEPYIIVFELAKERLEDLLGESESITNKAIKIATALVAFIAFLSGYLFNNPVLLNKYLNIVAWCGAAIICNIGLLVSLILPKAVKSRGLPPIISLVDNFDDKEDCGYQTELLLYNVISVLQENIDYMTVKNSYRSKLYKYALLLFLLLFAVIPGVVIYIISHP